MATAPSPPILVWTPGGGVPVGPVSNPPVYSQSGITQLIQGQAYVDVVFGSIQTTSDWVLVACDVDNTTDVAPLNIWPGIITNRTTAGFRLQLNGLPDSGNYYLHWAVSGVNIVPSSASTYYLTGPSTGGVGAPVTYTVHLPPSTTVPGAITITPSDGGAGGSFNVDSVVLSTSSASATFSYTPIAIGTVTISTTNSSSVLSDPAGIVLTVTPPAATTYTFTGPSSGLTGVASTNFTVALPGGTMVTGTVTVTPHAGDGVFTPTTVGLTTGAPSATFTYTPASVGTKTISVTNSGGLTDPGSISYVVTAPFDPSTIAGLKLWLKADSLALTDGALFSTWNDSSGNGNNFVALVGNLIYKTNIVNGKPVARCDGASGLQYTTSILPSATAYTIFAVASAASVSASSHTIFMALSQTIVLRRDAADLNQYHYAAPYAQNTETGGIVTGAWNQITCDWNGTNIHLWRNGTLKVTTAASTISVLGPINSLGANQASGGDYWNGDIAEILVYNTALSTTDRQNVELFLKTKYGL